MNTRELFKMKSSLLVTVAGMFWATYVVGEHQQKAFRAFERAVYSCNRGQLILILQSCLLETFDTKTQIYTL